MTILVLTLILAAPKPVRTEPIAIHVFTTAPADGLVNEAFNERKASVAHLEKALAKRKGITVTSDPDEATITVEIVRRDYSHMLGNILYATLTAGSYRDGKVAVPKQNGLRGNTWPNVADDLAERIDKWIDLNYDRLLELRAGKASR